MMEASPPGVDKTDADKIHLAGKIHNSINANKLALSTQNMNSKSDPDLLPLMTTGHEMRCAPTAIN